MTKQFPQADALLNSIGIATPGTDVDAPAKVSLAKSRAEKIASGEAIVASILPVMPKPTSPTVLRLLNNPVINASLMTAAFINGYLAADYNRIAADPTIPDKVKLNLRVSMAGVALCAAQGDYETALVGAASLYGFVG